MIKTCQMALVLIRESSGTCNCWVSLEYKVFQESFEVSPTHVSCVFFANSGDTAMVMRAESMDLRKLAEVNAGWLPLNKLRKYSSELASVMRCGGLMYMGGPVGACTGFGRTRHSELVPNCGFAHV